MSRVHAVMETPLGRLTLFARDEALTALHFAGGRHGQEEAGERTTTPVLAEAERQLGARFDRLDTLDGWWTSAAVVEPGAPRPAPELRPAAAKLLTRLALVQMPWHAAHLGSLLPGGSVGGSIGTARCTR